jgi:hypothetical protein
MAMPWIVTFGPMSETEEDWEPVVCGPYERAHAMSLAETVVADEELLAVVEPLNPYATVDEIRAEIDKAIAAAEAAEDEDEDEDDGDVDIDLDAEDHEHFDGDGLPEVEPTTPPSAAEIRAGFARIASRLASGVGAGV